MTRDKYEIILVDDGSTDHTADICMKAVKLKEHKLPRITYLLIEHSGLSVARNTGVFISKSFLKSLCRKASINYMFSCDDYSIFMNHE